MDCIGFRHFILFLHSYYENWITVEKLIYTDQMARFFGF